MGQPVLTPEQLALHDPEKVLKLRYVTLVAAGIWFTEYAAWLPHELRILRDIVRREKVPTAHYLVLGIRWCIMASSLLALVFFFARPSRCDAVLSLLWTTFTLGWGFTSALFALRVIVMWRFKRAVQIIFAFLWLSAMAIWIAVTSTYRGAMVPGLPPSQPWCAERNSEHWHVIGWAASAFYDCCVLVATLWRLHAMRHQDAAAIRDMRRFILRSNLLYFGLSFAAEVTCFVTQAAISNLDLAQTPVPLTFAIQGVLSSRVVFSAMNRKDVMTLRFEQEGLLRQARRPASQSSLPPSSRSPEDGGGGGGVVVAEKVDRPPSEANTSTVDSPSTLSSSKWADGNGFVAAAFARLSPPRRPADVAGRGGVNGGRGGGAPRRMPTMECETVVRIEGGATTEGPAATSAHVPRLASHASPVQPDVDVHHPFADVQTRQFPNLWRGDESPR